jgi:hypothetical protein
MSVAVDKFKPFVCYDKFTGKLTNKKTGALLSVDEYGYVVVYDNTTKKRYKISAVKLSWELGNNRELPEGFKVLVRNLNESDTRLSNLLAVPKSDFKEISEALRNLEKMKLVPHPEDQYSYVIHYIENGIPHKDICHDVITAKQQLIKRQLAAAKVINKYCIFD